MSVIDTSGLVPLDAIDTNPPPVAPETPAIDEAAGGSTEDSGGSSLENSGEEQATVVELHTGAGGLYRSPAARIATALTESAGGSPITLSGFETGVPPNLAAASTLMAQIGSRVEADASAKDAAYQLLSSDAVLALTGD